MSPRIQAQQAFPGGEGTYLTSDEEQRAFVQARLTLVAKVAFALIGGHFVVSHTAALAGGQSLRETLATPIALDSVVNLAVFGAVWYVMSRGRRSWKVLRTADPLLVIFYGASIAVACHFHGSDPFLLLTSVMPVTFAVLARSVLVPGAAPRTLVISLLTYVPVCVLAFVNWEKIAAVAPEGAAEPSFVDFVLRGIIGAVLAAVNSQVIYGLQRKVRKAEQLGQYRLEEKIGEGGMGEVYRGSHAMLRRPTAIKLIQSATAGEDSIARFEREVQLTSQLTHPNTIAVYDFGRTPDGTFYYAMEYLDGLDLEMLVMESGPQPAGRAIHILKQVCASLFEAHQNGLIHRDIKPGNIILCERGGVHDVVKVVDFGLVKDTQRRSDVTISRADTITGTPHYMSPEAIRAPDTLDARSDLYALGAVGYFLLTGKRLFEGNHFMEIASKHLETEPERPSVRLGKPLPEDLEEVILDCLEKDRSRRPPNARAMAARLGACRDAGAWSEEHAASWWRENGARLKNGTAPGKARRPTSSASSVDPTAATIQVDVERRS